MTKEQMRIAIAEACGWERWQTHSGFVMLIKPRDDKQRAYWLKCGDTVVLNAPIDKISKEAPNYTEDLNACFEMENTLQKECKYWPHYIDELAKLFRFAFPNQAETNWSQMCHATAAQRCEAFLRMKGLWTEPER